MSPADFATSFTLSIALPVMPFAAPDWPDRLQPHCRAPSRPVACSRGLCCSDFGLSDLARVGQRRLLARLLRLPSAASSGDTEAGINSASAATAQTVSNVDKQKGSDNSLTLVPLILLRLVQAGRIEHEFRQRAAEASMNPFGQVDAMRWC